MLKQFLLLLVCCVSTLVMAGGELKFEKELHVFGVIPEGDIATYEFKYTNVGDAPVILSNVQPSCGCTSPFWTKDPVYPGETGSIKVSYNSANRPGPFEKSITVSSDAKNPSVVLRIKGEVVPREEVKTYTEEELKKSPIASINKNEHYFGKIDLVHMVTYKIELTNSGEEPLQVSKVVADCRCVTYKTDKSLINKGEKAIVELMYQPHSVGEQNEKVTIYTNDRHNPKLFVNLKANVVESLVAPSLIQQNKQVGF